jgi:hypothetical protein
MNPDEYNFAKKAQIQKNDTSRYINLVFERIAPGILAIPYSGPVEVQAWGISIDRLGDD